MQKKKDPDATRQAGNQTTIRPQANVSSQYATNAVTNYLKQAGKRPAVSEIDVELARDFDHENQK
ncbi:MAG: hypothetical protein FWE32_05610 [Oscillospiraceae bacterium]|nr:hypothetical protein [Oscillospiraceae bacterium]